MKNERVVYASNFKKKCIKDETELRVASTGHPSSSFVMMASNERGTL